VQRFRGEVAERLGPGDHVCAVYEDPADWLAVAVPYVTDGLAAGERCVYIGPDDVIGALSAALAGAGVDVEGERRQGALAFPGAESTYLRAGAFDPDAMLELWGELARETESLGYAGCRVGGAPLWALDPKIGGRDRLIEYEVRVNEFFRTSRAIGFCQYDRRRFPPEVIRDVLRAHPVAVVGTEVCPNLYYEEPELAARGLSAAQQVDWMVAQIRRARDLERERTHALERARAARAEAEAANGAKDEFLAVVSHELRTPLNVIIGWVSMLRGGRLDAEAQARALEIVERNARAQTKLVEDLIDVSRIAAGRMRLELGRVDLVPLVNAAVDAIRPAAADEGLEIGVDLDPAPVVVRGDAVRLQQVLANLLANALKFTDRGRIDVTLRAMPAGVEIAVSDTGRGFDRDVAADLFRRFHQADSSTTRPHGGLGLGLTIVKSIVELHGGSVRAESAGRGRGATFTVVLPAADPRMRLLAG